MGQVQVFQVLRVEGGDERKRLGGFALSVVRAWQAGVVSTRSPGLAWRESLSRASASSVRFCCASRRASAAVGSGEWGGCCKQFAQRWPRRQGVSEPAFAASSGGEDGVLRGLWREAKGGQEFVAGILRAGALVDAGECAEGAGLEQIVALWHGGGSKQFSAGVSHPAGAGVQQAQREVRLEEPGVCGDGRFVRGLGGDALVQRILSGAEIVEQLGVLRIGLGEWRQQGDGPGKVMGVQRSLSSGDGCVLRVGDGVSAGYRNPARGRVRGKRAQ